MKTRLIFVGLLTVGVLYANEAKVELEHAIKTASSVESTSEDMAKMKASGKCNGDQSAKAKSKVSTEKAKPTKSATELEHANKSDTSPEGTKEDMSKMKASGKCSSGK